MKTLAYVSATTGEQISFEGPLYGETLPAMRGHKWSYTLGSHAISATSLPAREITIDIKALDLATLDRLRVLASADMQANTPGKLLVDRAWQQHALITTHEPQEITPTMVSSQLTVALLDGVWTRDGETVQCAVHTASGGTWLDLPTDLPFDLQAPRMSSHVVNPMLSACDWRMTIYGPAHNPRVRIAGNDYMLDVLIPQGGYVLVDQHDRTVTLTQPNGDVSNVLGSAHRGSGLGSGQYIFEPIPAGVSTIEWDGSFGFDLTPILLEVELPWSM